MYNRGFFFYQNTFHCHYAHYESIPVGKKKFQWVEIVILERRFIGAKDLGGGDKITVPPTQDASFDHHELSMTPM
jgi:hypothetical protein